MLKVLLFLALVAGGAFATPAGTCVAFYTDFTEYRVHNLAYAFNHTEVSISHEFTLEMPQVNGTGFWVGLIFKNSMVSADMYQMGFMYDPDNIYKTHDWNYTYNAYYSFFFYDQYAYLNSLNEQMIHNDTYLGAVSTTAQPVQMDLNVEKVELTINKTKYIKEVLTFRATIRKQREKVESYD